MYVNNLKISLKPSTEHPSERLPQARLRHTLLTNTVEQLRESPTDYAADSKHQALTNPGSADGRTSNYMANTDDC